MNDTIIASLKSAQVSLAAAIANVAANPLPNYSVEGQQFSGSEFMKMLAEMLKTVNEVLSTFDIVDMRTVAD